MHIATKLTLAAILSATWSIPGHAAIDPAPTATISIRGIDLSTEVGQAKLDHRIARAARAACNTVNRSYGPEVRRSQKACRSDISRAALLAAQLRRDGLVAAR